MNMVWSRLSHHLIRFRGRLLCLIGLGFTSAIIASLLPWPIKVIVDNVLHGKPLPDQLLWLQNLISNNSTLVVLISLAVVGLTLQILQRGIQLLQAYMEAGIGERLGYSLGEQLVQKLQSLSMGYHNEHSSGDLIRRVATDSRCLQEFVLGVFMPIFISLSTLILMFTVMWNMHSGLTMIALFAALPIPLLIKILSPRMTRFTYEHQMSEGRVMSLAEQTLSGLPVVQAFSQEDRQHSLFKQQSEQTMRDYLKSIKAQLEFSVGVSTSTAIGTAVMIFAGGLSVVNGSLSLGELLVFLSYLASLYGPIETLAYISSTYASAMARAMRVFEVLDETPAVLDEGLLNKLPENQHTTGLDVSFENIQFGYKEDQVILDNVSLEVKAGETIALVGSTGSGKSTLVSLIPRFYDARNGILRINGTDIKNLKLHTLRSTISMVLQDPYILPISIADNIAYGNPNATQADIAEAARIANVHEFVEKLPHGFETILTENGNDLSGGQRQRLSIARAMLKNSPILILDEPTSALDVKSESLFFEALEKLIEGRTSFIIAHRLSTIQSADRIVVLDQGQIVELGTHDELLHAKGKYYELCRMQFGDIPNAA